MKSFLKFFEIRLFLVVVCLSTFGIVMISSVTGYGTVFLTREVKFQLIGLFIGLIILLLSFGFNYKELEGYAVIIYIVSIFLIMLVFIPGFGYEKFGARSWIRITNRINLQPSEPAKIGFIIFLAYYFDSKKRKIDGIISVLKAIGVVLPFFGLLILQNDLGTLMVYVSIFAGMIFVAGIDLKIVSATLIAVISASPFMYNRLGENAKRRIDAFIHQNDSTLEITSHVRMSKITMGSGKFSGNGLFQGEFSHNKYLPVTYSDFIFPVIVEELGFIGGFALIFLYFYMMFRFIMISFSTKDSFGTNIVIGVMSMFAFQIFENIGMTMGLVPITGITLPFVSYGGSSILTSMIAISIVMNVYMRRFREKGF